MEVAETILTLDGINIDQDQFRPKVNINFVQGLGLDDIRNPAELEY